MRKVAYLTAVLAIASVVLSGCGRNVGGIPATVATVDGRKIAADDYVRELNRTLGQQVMRSMIEQQMMVAWAEEEEVGPTDEQIQLQIDVLKREGMYEDKVKEKGEEGVNAELEATQARINLSKKFYDFTDEELKEVYDQANETRQTYVHGPRKQVSLIMNSDEERVEEAYEELKDGMEFDKASSKYSDRMFAMRGPIKGWIAEDQEMGSPELMEAAEKTKKGEFSKVFKLEQPGAPVQYAILTVVDEQPKADLKLKDVKEEIQNNAALRKSHMDPDFREKLADRGKEAEIEIFVPEHEAVIEEFKNPPEPMAMPGMGMPRPAPAPKADEEAKPKPAEKE